MYDSKTCPYRFKEGKSIGGCGVGTAPKGSDTTYGCERLLTDGEYPLGYSPVNKQKDIDDYW